MLKVKAVRPCMKSAAPSRREIEDGSAKARDQGTEMYSAKVPTEPCGAFRCRVFVVVRCNMKCKNVKM